MAARVRLSARDLSVQPGSEVALDCFITNAGQLVDEFHLQVLGDAARWAAVSDPIRLMPGQEGVMRVVFSPPRAAATAAQAVIFGVQVSSTQDPAGTVVEEASLNVQAFADTSAELVPATSHGRRHARHELAIDNRGNQRLNAQLAAADPATALRFRFNPQSVVVGAGNAAFARLRVTARKRFWRGPARTHSFEVTVRPQGQATPVVVPGTMVQEAMIPRWLPVAALAAVAILALLAVAWLGLLRPAFKSAAQDAVQPQLNSQAAAAKNAKAAADQANRRLDSLPSPPPSVPPPTPTPGNPLGNPTDGRLAPGSTSFTIPDKSTLSITDLVIENPNDDTGMFHLQRVAAGASSGSDLLVLKLDNFRDLDYHFITPVTLTAGQKLQIVCQPATGTTTCGGAVYYTGFMKSPPPA